MSATHQIAIMGAISTKTVTIDYLDTHFEVLGRNHISQELGRLIRRGYMDRLEDGTYQLTSSAFTALATGSPLRSAKLRERPTRKSPQGPAPLSLQQRAWNAIRLTRARFSIADLIMIAVNATDKGARSNLSNFIIQLTRAGYLAELPTRAKSATHPKGAKQWILIRNTGGDAPAWQRAEQAFRDRNTNEVFPAVKPVEVQP